MPIEVQLSRKRGWRMPPNTISVARPGPFGNPFRVGDPGVPDAATAVRRFSLGLAMRFAQAGYGTLLNVEDIGRRFCWILSYLSTLRGKSLACWCKLGEPCHRTVLLEIANA